jgi:hypothetical protein
MYIAIHADDGILFGEDKRQIEKVLNGLQKSFEISDRKSHNVLRNGNQDFNRRDMDLTRK